MDKKTKSTRSHVNQEGKTRTPSACIKKGQPATLPCRKSDAIKGRAKESRVSDVGMPRVMII
ncbi:MAG: hypothetical protein R6W96_08670 [Clostridia bacterium]